jgi:uncharacterized protein YabE (DUF348 family)
MPSTASAAAPQDRSGPLPNPLRGPLVLLVLAAALLPPLAAPPAVPVTVDGREVVVRAHVGTAGEVLDAAGVRLAPDDRVLPAPDVPLGTAGAGAAAVTVERAVDVTVLVNGRERHDVRTPDATVAGALAAAGLTRGERDRAATVRDREADLVDGDVVRVTLPMPVRAVVEGVTLIGWSPATTAAGVLDDLGVALEEHHVVVPAPDAPLVHGTAIAVHRVEFVESEEVLTVVRPIVRETTRELYEGVVRVLEVGRDGRERQLVRITRHDGVEVAREVLSREVMATAEPRVERVGTRPIVRPDVWDELAQCEASGRWDVVRHVHDTLSYFGGLQFDPRTWAAFRPDGLPDIASEASREQQILVAEHVLAVQGWKAWPACSRRLGLR